MMYLDWPGKNKKKSTHGDILDVTTIRIKFEIHEIHTGHNFNPHQIDLDQFEPYKMCTHYKQNLVLYQTCFYSAQTANNANSTINL